MFLTNPRTKLFLGVLLNTTDLSLSKPKIHIVIYLIIDYNFTLWKS